MGSRPTAKQWLAVRQLCEGAAPTTALMADAIGVDDSSIYNRARTENWRKLDFRFPQVKALQRDMIEAAAEHAGREPADEAMPDGNLQGSATDDAVVEHAPDAVEMMARASRFVSRQILALMDKADRRGGRLDKAQIDGLVAMSRMMDRWEALAKERQDEDRKKSDDELAGLLKEIDARIAVLAEAEAKRLLEKGRAGQAG